MKINLSLYKPPYNNPIAANCRKPFVMSKSYLQPMKGNERYAEPISPLKLSISFQIRHSKIFGLVIEFRSDKYDIFGLDLEAITYRSIQSLYIFYSNQVNHLCNNFSSTVRLEQID